MSDRLPRKSRGPDPAVAAGEGNPQAGAGVNGDGSHVPTPQDAPGSPGVRFLPVNGVLGENSPADDVDSDFAGRWPAVWEYVTCRLFRGCVRVTATLLFFREDGQWKLCVSDRDTERVLFRTGDTIEESLDAAEKALASPRADWRQSKRGYSRK